MRQRRATWVMALVCVVLVGLVIAFGCERSAGSGEGATAETAGEHMMEGEHHHAEAAAEHGEHMGEAAVGGHHEEPGEMEHHEAIGEHGQMAAAAEETTGLEPSGKVVDGVRVVEVAARRFEFDPATIVVRQGETVRLEVTSGDVTHGIGIESYGIDETLPPKETKVIEFTATKPGRHHFHCSIYCGSGHNRMHGELVVVEAGE